MLRIVIVADDPLARAGLAALLAEEPDLVVSAQAGADADLANLLAGQAADVVVWDLGWRATQSLAAMAELGPEPVPILALVADESEAPEAWAAGASGVLRRESGASRLATALRAVAEGMRVIGPDLPNVAASARGPGELTLVEDLTPRELEVLQLLVEGLPNKAIAQRLDISEHTVKFHVNAILGKLGAQSRTEAVTRAARLGLILL